MIQNSDAKWTYHPIVLADIFLDFEPMRDGLITNPLSKAL
jgi:hypothetical protein